MCAVAVLELNCRPVVPDPGATAVPLVEEDRSIPKTAVMSVEVAVTMLVIVRCTVEAEDAVDRRVIAALVPARERVPAPVRDPVRDRCTGDRDRGLLIGARARVRSIAVPGLVRAPSRSAGIVPKRGRGPDRPGIASLQNPAVVIVRFHTHEAGPADVVPVHERMEMHKTESRSLILKTKKQKKVADPAADTLETLDYFIFILVLFFYSG